MEPECALQIILIVPKMIVFGTDDKTSRNALEPLGNQFQKLVPL
jgi:hypothetical protein